MNTAVLQTLPAALVGLACAGLLLSQGVRREGAPAAMAPLVALLPLAFVLVAAQGPLAWIALAIALVIALLARNLADPLHSECALKMVWVMGPALALSAAGVELLTLTTGTSFVREQWAVLSLGLDRPFLWSSALPLSLLIGIVLLGGAPFHFWVADALQGARPWLAPLAIAALQTLGARWLGLRTGGIEAFAPGASIVHGLVEIAALAALVGGAATLTVQRNPERRIGTLASLNGALVLCTMLPGRERLAQPLDPASGAWVAHTVLALTGAVVLARLLPVSGRTVSSAPAVYRRHPLVTALGLYAILSLAGVPGTPGSRLWLEVARDLADTGHSWILLAAVGAWLSAFTTAMRQVRETLGVPSPHAPPAADVPWPVRATLAISGGALIVLGLMWLTAPGLRG